MRHRHTPGRNDHLKALEKCIKTIVWILICKYSNKFGFLSSEDFFSSGLLSSKYKAVLWKWQKKKFVSSIVTNP